jgi:AcrR family transcriptional regulator
MAERLSQEAWLKAGFRALVAKGPEGIRIEPIARSLGATKGSFYWHFKDLAAFKAAMLAYWRDRSTQDIMDQADRIDDPHERLMGLIVLALSIPEEVGGAEVEPAIRSWARSSSDVAAALADVDASRIAYVQDCFAKLGQTDGTAGRVFYSAYVGGEMIGQTGLPQSADLMHLLEALT